MNSQFFSFSISLALVMIIGVIGSFSDPATTAYLYNMAELMILTYSLNIFTGLSGYINFGHVVYYGIGAYTVAVLFANVGAPIISTFVYVLAGGALACAIALLFGSPLLRIRGIYFAIATLGVNEAVRVVIMNTKQLGEGRGISIYKYAPSYNIYNLFLFLLIILFAAIIISHFIVRSKIGYGLRAIKADEDVAETMGVDTAKYKILSYALGAFFAGTAGGVITLLYAYAFPDYFLIGRTVDMLVALVLGGVGTILGPLIGTVIYYISKDALLVRFPYFHQLAFGLILIGLLRFLPGGIVGLVNKIISKKGKRLRLK